MAPHSSTLAWKIPWTEEPGGLQSMGSHRVGHNWSNLAAAAAAQSIASWHSFIMQILGFPGGVLPSLGVFFTGIKPFKCAFSHYIPSRYFISLSTFTHVQVPQWLQYLKIHPLFVWDLFANNYRSACIKRKMSLGFSTVKSVSSDYKKDQMREWFESYEIRIVIQTIECSCALTFT